MLTGLGGDDGGVQGQEVCLIRNALDHTHDVANFDGRLVQIRNDVEGGLRSVRNLIDTVQCCSGLPPPTVAAAEAWVESKNRILCVAFDLGDGFGQLRHRSRCTRNVTLKVTDVSSCFPDGCGHPVDCLCGLVNRGSHGFHIGCDLVVCIGHLNNECGATLTRLLKSVNVDTHTGESWKACSRWNFVYRGPKIEWSRRPRIRSYRPQTVLR